MSSFLKLIALVAAAFVVGAQAESHTVTFQNSCGCGAFYSFNGKGWLLNAVTLTQPTLKANGVTLSTGGAYTSNGPLEAAIAYLDVGCGANGEGCTTIETTLVNPTSPGSGSSTDISLIPPHAFSVTSGFGYYNGCDGAGADCTNANCPTAFKVPTDTHVQVACQVDNVDLVITFCD